MTKKKQTVSTGSTEKAQWVGFVQVNLPRGTDLDGLLELFDAPEPFDLVEALLEAGYKVSFSKDWNSGARIVSATGDRQFCVNAGLTTSTFAEGTQGGLLGTAWKCLIFNEGRGWDDAENQGTFEL